MPGTIQVTVLEFKGASSSSQPSAKYLKVSMGKRCYQTWDKGDFSFPIAKLGEDLIVTMLDAGGNDIARAAIRTMQIIEKGYWDEVFSLDGKGGGGHVHMKLQFILNDDERKRIRLMRETAIKKKHEKLPNVGIGLPESASSPADSVEISRHMEEKVSDSYKRFDQIDLVRPEIEASQAGSPLNSTATSSPDSGQDYPKEERSIVQSAIQPNATDESQSASSSPPTHKTVPRDKIENRIPLSETRSAVPIKNESSSPMTKGDPILESLKQIPAKRTPSTVRKMISAFENSQLQESVNSDSKKEVKPIKKALSVPTRLYLAGKEGTLDVWKPKYDEQLPEETLRRNKDNFLGEDLHDTTASTSGRSENSPADLIRPSTSKTATISPGETHEEQSGVVQADGSAFRQLDPSVSSVTEGRGPEMESKSSTMANIRLASNQKRKSLEYYKEEYYLSESSGMWIFPDNTRRLCITTAGKRVMRPSGPHQRLGAKTPQEKKVSLVAQTFEKTNVMHGRKKMMERDEANFTGTPESASGSSPDDSSNGIIGQVIKIVVIVGFGVFVLLKRQREPRKKKDREEKGKLFINPDFIDGRALTL